MAQISADEDEDIGLACLDHFHYLSAYICDICGKNGLMGNS
jgi:hypothetical protein